jgi:hypothetical protein
MVVAAWMLRAARFSAKTKETGARLWRRKSGDKVTGTLAPHIKTQLGRASARTWRRPNHQQPERFQQKRPAGPTSYLDQDQNQELTKEILRFGFNKNKMQTQNISLRTEPSLHPIRGGLRPPTLFLIGTKNWLTPNLD